MNISDELKCATVEILGTGRFSVSNYKGIIEYTDTAIRINTADFVVSIAGSGFEICYISDEEVCAVGKIEKVEFIH